MARLRALLEIVALILTISVCVAVIYEIVRENHVATVGAARVRTAAPPPQENSIPNDPVALDGAQLAGNHAAKIVVIEYSDFQCPFCGRFARETLPQFEKDYVQPGKVLFAFRQFPLESIHANALRAAEAALCAGDQNRFWQMHSAIFENQQLLDEVTLRDRAREAGVDVARFDSCLRGDDVANRIRADEKTGMHMLVTGTPTLFLGAIQADGRVKIVKRLSGALPFEQLKAAVDSVIAAPAILAGKSN